MAKEKPPSTRIEDMTAGERLMALTWEADRRNLSYGELIARCTREDREQILKAYLQHCNEKQQTAQDWLTKQREKKILQIDSASV